MKAGWEVECLGKLCVFENGDRGKNYPGRKAFVPAGVPFINAGHLSDGGIDWAGMNYIPEEHFGRISRGKIKHGDLLFCLRGSLGKFGHVDRDMSGAIASSLVIIRCNEVILTEFLIYFLRSDSCGEQIEKYAGGAAQPNLSATDLKKFQTPLPPLEEQKRIVAILDAAFEGLDRARAHVEANLQSARDLFEAYLKSIFNNHSNKWQAKEYTDKSSVDASVGSPTKGRAASTRHIKGDYGLSVLLPSVSARSGWRWTLLSELARMESGHTPSRRKPSFWGGTIPWIGIKDARNHHGERISKTLECATQAGIDNSSSRLLPKNTVCLSRTASVGYVTIMDREMATSQDFVNWVCGDKLVPDFLKLVLLAQGKELSKFSSGSIHQTIYFPEAKGFAICHPDTSVQKEIVATASKVSENSIRLILKYQAKLTDLDDLRQSLLQKAFAGELT